MRRLYMEVPARKDAYRFAVRQLDETAPGRWNPKLSKSSRYELVQAATEWCEENFGPMHNVRWSYNPANDIIYIVEQTDAAAFKIAWC